MALAAPPSRGPPSHLLNVSTRMSPLHGRLISHTKAQSHQGLERFRPEPFVPWCLRVRPCSPKAMAARVQLSLPPGFPRLSTDSQPRCGSHHPWVRPHAGFSLPRQISTCRIHEAGQQRRVIRRGPVGGHGKVGWWKRQACVSVRRLPGGK